MLLLCAAGLQLSPRCEGQTNELKLFVGRGAHAGDANLSVLIHALIHSARVRGRVAGQAQQKSDSAEQ